MVGQAPHMRAAAINAARQQAGDGADDLARAHISLDQPVGKGIIHIAALVIHGDALQVPRGLFPRAAVQLQRQAGFRVKLQTHNSPPPSLLG